MEAKRNKKKNTKAKRKICEAKKSGNINGIFFLEAKRKIGNASSEKKRKNYAKFSLYPAKRKRNESRFVSFRFEAKKILSKSGAPYS